MKPIVPSTYSDKLVAMGLDPRRLPRLAEMQPDTLRALMDYWSEATGADCFDCHVQGDLKAMTRRKRVAARMWDDWVRGFSSAEGALVFCDSCHQGGLLLVDRRDRKALGRWMDENLVGRLRRRDRGEHGCETCHGEPFDAAFLTKWGQAR